MAYFLRLIVFALLGLSGQAQAAFPPSAGFSCYSTSFPGWGTFTSATKLACAQQVTAHGQGLGTVHSAMVTACTSGIECGWGWDEAGALSNFVIRATATSTCPANSTGTTSCTCNSGYEELAGACVNPSEALCGALSGTETYASAPGNIAPGASSCNASGCMTTFANTLIRVRNAQGQYVTEGAATFTGATCTYSESTGSAQDTCPGGSSGQINGITTCVPYDPKLNTIETVGESTETTTEGTDTTSTSTTSTTTCNNGSCTTTTNVTTSVNGGPPTTKTTTSNEPQSDFCTKNPRSPQCGEGGHFGGGCGSFTCSGDAVQCALTLEVHRQNCKLNADTPEALLFTQEKNREGNQTEDLPGNETIPFGPGNYDSSDAIGGAQCVSDLTVSVWMVNATLPLSNICPHMAWLRYALLALGSLGWMFIVFRK